MAYTDYKIKEWELINHFKSYVENNNDVILIAYLLLKTKNKNINPANFDEMIENIDNESYRYLIKNNLKHQCFDLMLNCIDKFTESELKNIIINIGFDEDKLSDSTPLSIIQLSKKILNITEGDSVADICSGNGTFLLEVAKFNPNTKQFGIELNVTNMLISKIRLEMIETNFEIELGDAIETISSTDKKFDKIFSNYPLNLMSEFSEMNLDIKSQFESRLGKITKANSFNWLFNLILVELLNDNGKAIGIMSNGSAWNTTDKKIREYFVKMGYIEAIIALPEKMFFNTSIPTTMIVLSKNNSKVKMIDATNEYQKGRRNNSFSPIHTENIFNYYSNESGFSKFVSVEQIEKMDYVLNPIRYLEKEIDIKHGVKFDDVIESITRGVDIKASELDRLSSVGNTNNKYLTLSHIKDGEISEELPNITNIDPKHLKSLIKNNDFVISKTSTPFKFAVAEFNENYKVLATGNLYLVKLKLDKINPYYLKMFFESEVGKISIDRIRVGTVIQSIPISSLRNMIIPVPPMNEQIKLVEKYLNIRSEIKLLNLKINKAKIKINLLFDEEYI